MNFINGIIGLFIILIIGIILSSNRKNIKNNLKRVLIMLIVQFLLAFVSLKTTFGINFLASVSDFMNWLLNQSKVGVDFVFGGLRNSDSSFVFFFDVLLPLVLISVLISILNYFKILPFIMKWVGKGVNSITRMGEVESQFSIISILLGQPAAYLAIKKEIKSASNEKMFTLCMSCMSTVGVSMLASYMNIIEGKYVVVAVLLNLFSAFIISSIVNPYIIDENDKELINNEEQIEQKKNLLDIISSAILDGFNLAVIITAMLIGFTALISLLNSTLITITGISFTKLIGYIFSPIALLIGVPFKDIVDAGSVMAVKFFTNELVGMGEIIKLSSHLSTKTVAMISTYLVSFANIGSIGLVTGAIKAIDDKKASFISSNSIKILLTSTLSSLLTATIVGFFY